MFYDSPKDKKIESDVSSIEKLHDNFAQQYENQNDYFEKEDLLLKALKDFENLVERGSAWKPVMYFHHRKDLNSADDEAEARKNILISRLTNAANKTVFFTNRLSKISKEKQKYFLGSDALRPYQYFLKVIFDEAGHNLTEAEEKILNLKILPARELWISGQEKLLNSQTILFGGKAVSLPEAMGKLFELPLRKRHALGERIVKKLREVSFFAEQELNAVFTNKKIDDQLRKFPEAYSATVLSNQNEAETIKNLVKTVSENFSVSHDFYALKAKLMGEKRLLYSDRAAAVGKTQSSFSFKDGFDVLAKAFGAVDPEYTKILESFAANGQIDVFPQKGKTGGAYCSGSQNTPTLVLLNFTENTDSVMTFSHEMGHSIHTELAKKNQPALYRDYSYATAEIASTLFENFAFAELFERLSDREKIIALHDRLNDDIQTIFRQVACFNFELALHQKIRVDGFASKEEIAALLNREMKKYLGPIFDLKEDDGYFFVSWPHIRRFFYVYTYAFGQLTSKAMYRKFLADKNFAKNIRQFLSAGGSNSPENILRSIGINVSDPAFFREGIQTISDEIKKLRALAAKTGLIR